MQGGVITKLKQLPQALYRKVQQAYLRVCWYLYRLAMHLFEKYQGKMGLDGATKYSKYIWPLVMVSLVVQLIYVLMN